jgi:hypothetical protein
MAANVIEDVVRKLSTPEIGTSPGLLSLFLASLARVLLRMPISFNS